jgi:hypothetical protein
MVADSKKNPDLIIQGAVLYFRYNKITLAINCKILIYKLTTVAL